VEGRRNRKPSRKILDLLESAGQRPVSAILAAAVGPEVAAAIGPEVAATAAGPEVGVVRPEVVTSGDRKRGSAAKRRSHGDGAGGDTGIEEPLYKSVQVRYGTFVNEDE
jgi:hypothetical protein